MRNKALSLLFLSNGLFVLAGSLLGPLYAIYVAKFTEGVFPVTLSWATFLLSTTLFSVLLFEFGDKIKENRLLLVSGFLIRAVGWFLYIFVNNIYALIAIQFLLGMGEAVGTPAFEAIFSEHLDKEKKISEYSEWKIISNVTLILGTLLGGFIVEEFGFTPLFMGMSTLAILSIVAVIVKPKKLL